MALYKFASNFNFNLSFQCFSVTACRFLTLQGYELSISCHLLNKTVLITKAKIIPSRRSRKSYS